MGSARLARTHAQAHSLARTLSSASDGSHTFPTRLRKSLVVDNNVGCWIEAIERPLWLEGDEAAGLLPQASSARISWVGISPPPFLAARGLTSRGDVYGSLV